MNVGDEVPVVQRAPDAVDLFMFSAASWLIHRIHYDVPFTTEHDGHPGLLVHGPLQGTYMIQSVSRWLGREARLVSTSYRHLAPAYLGDELECGGEVVAVDGDRVDFELWVRKSDGTVTTKGTATYEVMQT
ncbi:MAG TPA: hotdog domain-containing protein [Acidimicrobiia bacterium]|jgi:hydroxyacyl-ACP dehydratase HTD2-like protein with hotdog domain